MIASKPQWLTCNSQLPLFQVANNNRPGDDAPTKEIEELKKKLAAKTQDLGTSPTILYPPNHAIDDPPQMR